MPIDRSQLPPLGPDPPFRFPPIVKRCLESGLGLWVVERHDLPVVSLVLVLPDGAAADPPHRPGLAALAGDLLDEGAGERGAIEIHEALAAMGAQFDVEVGVDATWLTLTVLTPFLEEGLALVADMVARPRFEVAEFQRVRDLRLNRLRQLRSLPPALADRVFLETLYRGHPYGHLPLGTEAALTAVDRDEVAAFHETMADPTLSTLILVGAVTPDEAARAADRAFRIWKSGRGERSAGEARQGHLARLMQAPSLPVGPPPVVVHRPGAPQSELRLGHAAASRHTPDYHALLVLNMVLGGQFTSRLNMRLREEQGVTYGVRSVFEFRRGPGPFIVQMAVQGDATAVAIQDVQAEIAALRGVRPPDEGELDRARAALVRGYPRNFETAEQIARGLAQVVTYNLPDDEFSRFTPAVSAIDGEQLVGVARHYLDPERLLPVIVGDGEVVVRLLEAAGFGAPVVLSVEA